jgi:hypothetical protein
MTTSPHQPDPAAKPVENTVAAPAEPQERPDGSAAAPTPQTAEISDDQLEEVAGGTTVASMA